jgi:hypothetical protein
MNSERERRLSVLCQATLAPAPEARSWFLSNPYPSDERLREAVASLLQNEPRARSFLETPRPPSPLALFAPNT